MSKERILIVDDEKNIVSSLTGILSDEGYEISTTGDGVEALEIIQKDPPDLVLLDIWLPGMDGIEVLKTLKEKNYKLGILSNGTPALLNELIESNNLKNIFDDVFSIEEVEIYKPSSKVYDLPIKKYNIQKNELAFLSANTWDVSGGGNYGYNSIWVNRNKNIFDNLDYKPSNEIINLKQLLDLV